MRTTNQSDSAYESAYSQSAYESAYPSTSAPKTISAAPKDIDRPAADVGLQLIVECSQCQALAMNGAPWRYCAQCAGF